MYVCARACVCSWGQVCQFEILILLNLSFKIYPVFFAQIFEEKRTKTSAGLLEVSGDKLKCNLEWAEPRKFQALCMSSFSENLSRKEEPLNVLPW